MPELKVMKAPSELIDINSISKPYAASIKYDGVRCLIKNGVVHSSTMRQLPNTQLRQLLAPLLKHKNWVFDGEIYSSTIKFQDIVGTCMAHDRELPDDLGFYCFDILSLDEWKQRVPTTPYRVRYDLLKRFAKGKKIYPIEHVNVESPEEIQAFIDKADKEDHEGIMLRCWESPYKHGRSSVRQDYLHKYKFWIDYDAKIISVHEMIGYKEGIEREKDPTGRTKATHKQEHMEPKDTFGHFTVEVDIDGSPQMKVGGWKGLTHEVRKKIWESKDSYIGLWIRFQSMKAGQDELPRIPKNIEFRDPKC